MSSKKREREKVRKQVLYSISLCSIRVQYPQCKKKKKKIYCGIHPFTCEIARSRPSHHSCRYPIVLSAPQIFWSCSLVMLRSYCKKKKKNGKEFGCRAGERMGEGRLVAGLLARRPSLTLTIPRTDARLERPPECRDSFSSTGNQKCQGPPPRALPYTEPGEGRAGRPRSQSPCIYS